MWYNIGKIVKLVESQIIYAFLTLGGQKDSYLQLT